MEMWVDIVETVGMVGRVGCKIWEWKFENRDNQRIIRNWLREKYRIVIADFRSDSKLESRNGTL